MTTKVVANALTEHLSRKRNPDDRQWVEGHLAEYNLKDLRWGEVRPHLSDQKSPWFPTLRDREQDVLAVCSKLYPQDYEISASRPGMRFGRDVSQSVKRRVGCSTKMLESGDSVSLCSTVMPMWRFWAAHPFHRLVVGEESLAFQMFPCNKYACAIASTSDNTLTDLGGNAMNAGVLCAIFLSTLMSAPWATCNSHSASSDETKTALSALASIGMLKFHAPRRSAPTRK